MNSNIFLIDANSLITPHLRYYSFDFAPGFWEQMKFNVSSGKIAILDMVKNEILQGNDDLKKWMESLYIKNEIEHKKQSIILEYSKILNYIQKNPCYKDSALHEWSREIVADPWLIATASVYGYTLITLEEPNRGLNSRTPSKNAKIPDVANVFGVRVGSLFDMMRELKFNLR